MKTKLLIIIGVIIFSFIIPNAFASEAGYYSPQFDDPRSISFTMGLFFSAFGIIGVCIFLIIRFRKSNPSRIKWFYLFISLSLLLIFSILYITGAFDALEKYLLGV